MSFLDRVLKLDRRWIFIFITISVSIPLFLHTRQAIPITPEARGIYDSIQKLPEGSKVLLACDYDPGTAAEIQPMVVAFLKQAFTRRLRVIIMGLWPQGPQQADLALREILVEPNFAKLDLKYGIDYVNLGFQSGNEVVIQRMGSDIPAVFPHDVRGEDISHFPIMRGVKDFSSIAYVFNASAGYPGTIEWVQFAGDRFHTKIGSGSTAVQTPQVYPYFPRQMTGVLGGMKGAAEYEEVTGFSGKGGSYMLSQSFAHIVVVLFIMIGNAAYFLSRRRKQAGEDTGP